MNLSDYSVDSLERVYDTVDLFFEDKEEETSEDCPFQPKSDNLPLNPVIGDTNRGFLT